MVVFDQRLDGAFGRATLDSLYCDQIPPFLANLQYRWQEIVTEYQKATGVQLPPRKLTVQDLLKMFADQSATLVIVDQEGDGSVRLETTHSMLLKQMELRPGKPISPQIARREVTANSKLCDNPEVFFAGFRITPVLFEGFIDPFSADVYPDSMWVNFTGWLDSLKWQNAEISRFQGGRYGAAKEISRWELPFFHRRSLGEMIHIVQLALTSKDRGGRGLLSYQPDKTIAPCSFSEQQCLGMASQPHHLRYVGEGCASDAERWAELRDVLRAVLSQFPEGRSVALLKLEIERQCGMILDQRVFGQEKLSHVFESPELIDFVDMRREAQVGSNAKVLLVRLKDVQPTQALKAALGLRTFEDPQARWRPSQPVVMQPPPLVDHPNPAPSPSGDIATESVYYLPTLLDHPNPTQSPSGDIASESVVDVHTALTSSLSSTKLGDCMSESEGVDMSFHHRASQTRNEEIRQRNQALRESAMRSEMQRRGLEVPSLCQESASENTRKAQLLLCL